jgi:HK97 family phage major capsid protein
VSPPAKPGDYLIYLKLVGRALKGTARFGKSQRGQEVFQDVVDGVVRSVSIGYEYLDGGVPEDSSGDVLRFKFCPLEVSAVSIPADPNAGFFRSKEIHMEQNMNEQGKLSRSQRRAAGAVEERIATANELERGRCVEITAMCRQYGMPELGAELIQEGASIDEARRAVLDEQMSRGRQQPVVRDHQGSDYLDMGNEAKSFSITRAINAVINNNWREAGLERAASDAIAKRLGRQSAGGFFVPRDALQVRAPYSTGAIGTGGAMVATNLLASSFIDILRNKTQVLNLGATLLSGLIGNVDVPRRTATTPAYWVSEGSAITEGEGTFDQLSLTPKTVGALSQYSRNMLMQSTPDIEMLIRSDLAAQLGLGIDLAAIDGQGPGSNQPTGIMGTAGIGIVAGGTNGAQVTLDNLIDLATTVASANADIGSPAYMTNAKVLGWLSKAKASTGQYLWEREEQGPNYAPVGGSGDNLSVLGKRLAITNQVPSNLTKGTSVGVCSAVIYGNWSDLVIGEWGILEILPNPYDSAAYAKGSVLIRAMQTIDIGVRHAGSFAVMSDALTA